MPVLMLVLLVVPAPYAILIIDVAIDCWSHALSPFLPSSAVTIASLEYVQYGVRKIRRQGGHGFRLLRQQQR